MLIRQAVVECMQAHTPEELDRLAYLAMTGKLENAVRDRVAHWVHVRHGTRVVVGRDLVPKESWIVPWSNESIRIDIAVVPRSADKQSAELVEAKQFYTFDYLASRGRLEKRMWTQIVDDANRLQQAQAGQRLHLYLLLLCIHVGPPKIPDDGYPAVEKYNISHRAKAADKTDPTGKIVGCLANAKELRAWSFSEISSLALGTAFGYPVKLSVILGEVSERRQGQL